MPAAAAMKVLIVDDQQSVREVTRMTLEQIGQRLGITKERVRQLNVRIMKKLKDLAEEHATEL